MASTGGAPWRKTRAMRQRAREIALVVLALWGAAAAAGVSACSVEGPVPRAPGDEPAPPTPGSPGPGPEGAPESPQPSSAENDEDVGAENGQTGSLSPGGCNIDLDCIPVLENLRPGDAEYVLLDSACEHRFSGLRPAHVAPACVCHVGVTRSERDRDTYEVSRQTSETVFILDNDEGLKASVGPLCQVEGAVPGECAYCDADFPGCDLDSATDSCAAPCADAVQRRNSAAQAQHDVELRHARCSNGSCELVLRVDDDCYNQDRVRSSCSLSDDEIVNAPFSPASAGEQCESPALPCQSASDCPAALGCDGRGCGPCGSMARPCLLDENGECQGTVFTCSDGEVCITEICVDAERAACIVPEDCPTTDAERDPRVCALSGVDNDDGRGNRQTRSYCTSQQPNLFGLRVGDVLEVRVVGSADAVASTFDPPLGTSSIPCGEGTGFGVGTVHRLRVELLLDPESDYYPAASWLDPEATVDSVPPPVHPRDPALGR